MCQERDDSPSTELMKLMSKILGPMKSKQSITKLRNLGPRSEQLLAFAGIKTVEELRGLGSVAAYARVVRACKQTNLNLLWAIEGALTDLPWQTVARLHRATLLLALEDYQRADRSEQNDRPM